MKLWCENRHIIEPDRAHAPTCPLYKPTAWRHTLTLQGVELEAMRAYEALAASPVMEDILSRPNELLTA